MLGIPNARAGQRPILVDYFERRSCDRNNFDWDAALCHGLGMYKEETGQPCGT